MAPNSRPKHGLYCRLRSRIAPLFARSRPAGSQCVVSAVRNNTVALNSSDARDGGFEASSDTATPQPSITGHDCIATQGATAQNPPPLQERQESAVLVSTPAIVSSPSTASNSAQTHSSTSPSPSAGGETSQETVDPLSLLPGGRRESLRAIVLAAASQHSVPVADSTTRDGSPPSSASANQADTYPTERVGPTYESLPPEPGVSSPDLAPGLPPASDAAFAAGAQSFVPPLVAAIDRLGDRLDNFSTAMTRGLQEINGSVGRIAGRLDDRHSTGVTTPQLEESPTASISYTTLDAPAAQEPAIVHPADGPPNPGAWPSPVPLATTPSPLGAGVDVTALQAQLAGVSGVPPNLLLTGAEVRLPAGTEGRSTAPAGAPAWVAEEQATDEPRTHRLHAHIMLPPDDEDQASGCAIQPEPRIGLQDHHSNAVDEGPATDADADNAADSVPLPAIPEVSIIAPTLSSREVEVPTVRSPAAPPTDSRPPIVAAQEARLEDAEEQDGRATGTNVGPDEESSASAADPASPSPPAEDGFIDSPESTAPAAQAQATIDDDPIWTLIGCRTTQEFCPGTLQLVIDAGTDGEVGDCQVLLRADFEKAMDRLPMICEDRKVNLTQLYLRVGRAQDRHGEDTMLRVMRCLKPYLRFFLSVHLILKQDCNIHTNDSERLHDFSRLLSLRVEGQANLDCFLSFPLHNLRYLDIKGKMDLDCILKVVDQSKELEVLTLNFISHDSVDNPHPKRVRTQGVRFPPVMLISTPDPKELVPHLRAAESMSTDVRLTISCSGSCSPDVSKLFSRNAHWLLKIL